MKQEKKHTGHGDHWNSVIEGFTDTKIGEVLTEITNTGEKVLKSSDGQYALIIKYQSPIQGASLVRIVDGKNQLVSAFPILRVDNILHITIESISPNDEAGEGYIQGTARSGIELDFFDPLFCINRSKYEIGKEYAFNVGAILYNFEERKENLEFVADSGPEKGKTFKMQNTTAFTMTDFYGEFQFATPFRGFVSEFEFNGSKFAQLIYRSNSGLTGDPEEFSFPMIIRKDSLKNYEPKDGDPIMGSGWLQGYLMGELLK